MPRVAHIFALAGVLSVSTGLSRSESIPSHETQAHEKKLVIFLSSDSANAPAASSPMKRELSNLMQTAAIRVEWQDPSTGQGGLENDYSAVIRLRGSCRPTAPDTHFQHSLSGPFPLASSEIVDGVILPFGDIDCAALNSFLGPSLWRMPGKEQESLYGRAVARLIAHELFHMIARATAHARSGVAEPAFTVAELLSDHFEFTESTRTELRSEAGDFAAANDSEEVSGK